LASNNQQLYVHTPLIRPLYSSLVTISIMSLVQAIMTTGDAPVVDSDATFKARGSEHIVTLSSSANERLVAKVMKTVFPTAGWGDRAAGEITIPLFQLGIMAMYGATTSHGMPHVLEACVPTPRKCVDILPCLINLGIDKDAAPSVAAWELRVHSLLESRGASLPGDLNVAKYEWFSISCPHQLMRLWSG